MELFIVLASLSLLVILIVKKGVVIVSQSETKVIERLGKYDRTLPSGLNIIWPIIDRAKDINARRVIEDANGNVKTILTRSTSKIDLREQVYDFPKQNVITRDNVMTEINALLYFQITDPKRAVYEIDNLPNAIEKLTQTTLRNVIGEMELDDTLSSRDIINSKLRSVLDEATNKWGVKVNRVELQDIMPPRNIQDAMEKQMQAERNRRAEILRAEGEKTSAILKSEGQKESLINNALAEKQALILAAEGAAEAVVLQATAEMESIRKITAAIAEANTNMNPANFILATKYIETLKEMVNGKDTKTVYMPYDASSVMGALGGIKELFNK